MRIRLATQHDRPYLIRDYLLYLTPDLEEANRYALLNLEIDHTLVAEVDGLIVGTLSWSVNDGIGGGLAQITGLRVIPSRRGQGIGRKLLETALYDIEAYYSQKGSSLRRIFVWIGDDQTALMRLFASVGFVSYASLYEFRRDKHTDYLYVWLG